MTRLGPSGSPSDALQHRLILNKNSPPISISHAAVKDIDETCTNAQEVLDAISKILYAEVSCHAHQVDLTREQSGYLVGWHDALHAIRYLAGKLARPDPLDREHTILGVPSCPSFPDNASIEQATRMIMLHGPQFMSDHEHHYRPRLNMNNSTGATPFGGHTRPRHSQTTGITSPSFSDPIDTPLPSANISSSVDGLLYDEHPLVSGPRDRLFSSVALRAIPTTSLVRLYEREARLSETKILAELARSRLIRQAVFQDRFFGNVPAFPPPAVDDGSDYYLFGDDVNQLLVSEAQESRTLRGVKQTFRDWRRTESAASGPARLNMTAPRPPRPASSSTRLSGFDAIFRSASSNDDAGSTATPLAPPPVKLDSPARPRKYTFVSDDSQPPSPKKATSPYFPKGILFGTGTRSPTTAATEPSVWPYMDNSSTSAASNFDSEERAEQGDELRNLQTLAERLEVDDHPAPSSSPARSGERSIPKRLQRLREPKEPKQQRSVSPTADAYIIPSISTWSRPCQRGRAYPSAMSRPPLDGLRITDNLPYEPLRDRSWLWGADNLEGQVQQAIEEPLCGVGADVSQRWEDEDVGLWESGDAETLREAEGAKITGSWNAENSEIDQVQW